MYRTSSPIILPLPLLRYRMDNQNLRRLLHQFWHRHRPMWCFVREYDPGFWADLWKTEQLAGNLRWTQEAAVIREFPEMRDTSAQAQTMMRNRSTQTSPTSTQERGVQAEDRARETSPGRTAPPSGGCWNCRSPSHGYTRCSCPRRTVGHFEPFLDKILVTTQILMKSSEVFFFIFKKACTITRYCGNLIVISGKL